MSHDHPTQPQTHAAAPPAGEAELIIDTSKMSADKRAAMEIAEGARDRSGNEGFGAQMFMGRFAHELLAEFPEQEPGERAIGDRLCEEVGAFLRDNLDPEEVDASRTIPAAVVEGLARMGIFAMKVPAAYGGLGLSQVNYNRVMMRIASWCGSTAVLVSAHQSIGVPQPLKLFGTEAQKQAWFPRFRAGAISAFALTEPGVGSDPSKLSTTAELSADGRHWILSGEKLWCTNGPIADILVVMARTPPKVVNGVERAQITALVVEKGMPGISVVHRCDFMGIRGIQNGLLRFDRVEVPVENVLWGEGKGLKLALTTLNTGRLTLPAATTGMAKQCLSFCRRWGAARTQWGLPVGAHEFGRHKLAWIAGHTLAMEAVTWLTSHWADQGRDLRLEAAMAKLFTSETAWRIVDMTMQMRGGRGYEKASSLKARGEAPYPVERMMRDCRINLIIEGTSEIMRLFLAREAMDPHLRLAADVIRPGVPAGTKMRAGARLAAHYGAWYAQQWFNGSLWHHHDEMGPLAGHYHYIEAGAHRLARAIFHQMGLHRDKLERRQLILGRLMDVGTDLFAMAATCSYARHLGTSEAEMLADHFCREAVRRIETAYRELAANHDAFTNRVGKAVLGGDMTWLEEGVERIGDDG
ncbi:MAG: acyl-CoA dehydrogenase family protein [Planctomycetes bacterium]|nr:acyl-CoA dehydrogenase family protein [Planctomycetota bacterium]